MPDQRSILIVEDDQAIRDVYEELLRDEGYRVASAANGREAMRLLRDGLAPPDLVIMDLLMPVLDGWGLAAEMAATPELARIPFLVLAAQAAPFGRPPPSGARAQMVKPAALEELLATVASCWATPGGGTEQGRQPA